MAPPPPPKPSAKPSNDAPVLLVVEDDPDIRALLVKALGVNFTVYEAADGEEARRVLGFIPPPAAMLCDVMMPRLDGLSLAKAMKKTPGLDRVPILFLTAKDTPLDIIAGINAGARHYVTKPFKIGDVLAKVKAMTKNR